MEPDYKALCKRLSDALIKVRPLGGSELFIRVGSDEHETFIADPDYCGAAIEKLRSDLHQARSDAQRLMALRQD